MKAAFFSPSKKYDALDIMRGGGERVTRMPLDKENDASSALPSPVSVDLEQIPMY